MRLRARTGGGPRCTSTRVKPDATASGGERFDGRDVPVAEVGVEVAARVELEQTAARVAGNLRGDGFDHRDVVRDHAQPLQTRERFLHVVEHAEVQHDVERAQRGEVHRREVGDDGLDATVERAVREVEPAPSGKVRAPEVGRVARLIGQHTALEALVPVLRAPMKSTPQA